MKKPLTFLLANFCLMVSITSQAQVSGAVYKDFNGNGIKDTYEPFAGGIVINAYDANDAFITSAISTASLTGTTNYSLAITSYPVRLEFIIPSAGLNCVKAIYDLPGNATASNGTNVQFISSSTTAANFAINNPTEYVKSDNPYFYTVRQGAGNPLAAYGNATTRPALEATPYNANLNTPATTSPAQRTMAAKWIGNCYGLAYSKQAGKIFVSASVKRHFGLGPIGSGGIYMVDTALGTPASAASIQFYDMDAHGYNTRSASSSYGSGTSFTTPTSSSITYLGATDPVTGYPAGMGVIGTNTERGMTGSATSASNDAAAFGQAGIYGLGDLELTDDGGTLFSVNLYDRKIYKLTLNSITSPTAVSAVTSFALPAPPLRNTVAGGTGAGYAATYAGDNTQFYDGTKGYLRPYAVKYYRGKLYVGAVTTGEKPGAATTTDNNAGNPEYTDLWAYVFEFDPSTNTWASAPVVQFPLNFNRGTNTDGYNETFSLWKNNSFSSTFLWHGETRIFYAQAMLTGIEFDPADGSMILGFRDRIGDQIGHFQYQFSGSSFEVVTALGEILRAYRTSSCSFQLESNGKEGASSSKAASAGASNGQGPGNGEFYFRDNVYNPANTVINYNWHMNCTEGAVASLPGTGDVMSTSMDPGNAWQQGTDWFSNNTGDNVRNHCIEASASTIIYGADGYSGKGYGLGDIELLSYEAPIEIGNRIWSDGNANGIQDAGETGIANVTLELFADFNNDGVADGSLLASVTSGANGDWFFNNSNVTDGDPLTAGNQPGLKSNSGYIVQVSDSDWNSVTGTGSNDLASFPLTILHQNGNGQTGFSDNDAYLTTGVVKRPQIKISTANRGENLHNYDFGFIPLASIGDKAWRDDNKDGIQDAGEPGIANITVTLYASNGTSVLSSVATDINGKFIFENLQPGQYIIGFSDLPYGHFSPRYTTAEGLGTNSDVDTATGKTSIITVVYGEKNLKIDAGVTPLEVLLPLTLLEFTAAKTGNDVTLKWSTSQEINSNYIEVEHAVDGIHFSPLGKLNAAGNSVTTIGYDFTDLTANTGKNYYRLKLVGKDGTISYSALRLVVLDNNNQVTVYPNPVQTHLNILFSNKWLNKQVKLSLFNQAGQQVLYRSINNCRKLEDLQLNQLPQGSYMLKLQQADNNLEYKKIQILK